MLTYILRKMLYMPFVLLGVLFITFVLFQMSTTPEALARVQLGEKVSSRVINEWMVGKGHARWTDNGLRKRELVQDGKLDGKETTFFVDGRLSRLASRRDSADRLVLRATAALARAQEGRAGEETVQNLQGDLAVAARRRASIRIDLKEALLGARQAVAAERFDIERAKAAAALDAHQIELEWAEADIAHRREHGLDTAELEAARQAALDAFLEAAEGKAELWRAYLPIRAEIANMEDITPDLTYTAWLTTFVFYVRDTLTLDFGDTNRKRPVTEVLWQGMGPSLALMLPAFLLAELIGVFFGLMAAMYRQTRVDHVIVVSAILLMSINAIALVMFGQKFLAADLHYFPISGFEGGFAAARYLILPIMLYVVLAFGERVRFARIVMLDETNQDYVRTARAKGLGENKVLFKHILRNTLIPLITRWVVAIPTLYLGSLVLESFFGIPGLGYLMVDAVHNSDANVIRALVVIGSVGFMLANLLSDVLYAVVDPRVRLE